ncbi:MAG: hypothetical protein ACLQBK_05045 [Candidatus Sulfotelmatobacter sp.]
MQSRCPLRFAFYVSRRNNGQSAANVARLLFLAVLISPSFAQTAIPIASGLLSSPTTNGNCIINFNVTGGAAVAPTCQVQGLAPNAQTGSYNVQGDGSATSDRGKLINITASSGSPVLGVSQAGTTPTTGTNYTGTNNNFYFRFCNGGSVTVAVDQVNSATSTFTVFNGTSATTGLTTFNLTTGQCADFTNDGSNWIATLLATNVGGGGTYMQIICSAGPQTALTGAISTAQTMFNCAIPASVMNQNHVIYAEFRYTYNHGGTSTAANIQYPFGSGNCLVSTWSANTTFGYLQSLKILITGTAGSPQEYCYVDPAIQGINSNTPAFIAVSSNTGTSLTIAENTSTTLSATVTITGGNSSDTMTPREMIVWAY